MDSKDDKGHGWIYVNENCWRAISDLASGSGSEWRERIKRAVFNAHRPADTDFFTQWMSEETLAEWRACLPEKSIDDMTDEEVMEIAQHLGAYLLNCQRDLALRTK